MRKIFTLLMAVLVCCTLFAEETTGVKLKVYRNDGQAYECLLSKVDSVKFIEADEETEKADSGVYIVEGALVAASYKVSDSMSVYFSKGNLQFNAMLGEHATADNGTAKGTWRFAENQYDVIGDANKNIDSTYTDWIDLFGWGTSGWESGAKVYYPWATTDTYSYYYPGGDSSNNLTDDFANADWGVYNAISNGGDEPNKWRTLTASEWQYLFKNNKWTMGYIKTSEKDSSLCFMLIPATFSAPEGTTVEVIGTANLTSTRSDFTVPSTNIYTAEQFASFEKLGVVALPCGGCRRGTRVIQAGSYALYWSSTANSPYYAYVFFFYSTNVGSDGDNARGYGLSVRLVQNVQ